MTREEFHKLFRGRMLLFLTEAWAARKEAPSELGALLDAHAIQLRNITFEMYDTLCPQPPTNNKPVAQPARKANP